MKDNDDFKRKPRLKNNYFTTKKQKYCKDINVG